MKVRPIKLTDAKDIKKYCFKTSDVKSIRKYIKEDLKEMKKGNLRRFVLEIDGKAVGNISIRKEQSPIKQHIAEIDAVVIFKEYQGKGYSTLLVKKCFEWAKKHRIEIIKISVRKGTKAQKVYEHLGFKKYGELKRGIKAPWEKKVYDEVFYYKRLK